MKRAVLFAREQLRTPFSVALLVLIPVLFVISAAGALRQFAGALGGSLAADAAVALGAGWAAAFVSGTLGFFQATSSRGADRRLSLAGLGPARVAGARIGASIALATLAAAAALVALQLRAPAAHPVHAAVAVQAFALLYLSVGIVVGSLVSAPLEGSLLVVFVFMLDVFAGPGMAGTAAPWSISRKAGTVLIDAASGARSSTTDWLELAAVTVGALLAALVVFVRSARSRA